MDLATYPAAIVPALDGAMQLYDLGTAQHSARVGHMATVVAAELRLRPAEIEAPVGPAPA